MEMGLGRRLADVAEVEVQDHDRSLLTLADGGDVLVRVATEPLIEDGHGVVAG